jgi:hypothetical protein
LASTVTFGYVPCHHARRRQRGHPCRHRQPADRIDLDDALAGGRGVRVGERAERLARREVDHGVHRHVVAGVQGHPEVARVVGLAPFHRTEVGQAHQARGSFVSGPELRALLERLQAGDGDRTVLQDVVARRRRPEFVLDGHDRRLDRGDEAGNHVGLHRDTGEMAGGNRSERPALAACELRGGLRGVDDQLVVDGEDAVCGGETAHRGRDVDGGVARANGSVGGCFQGLGRERIDGRVQCRGGVDGGRKVRH